MMKVLSCKIGEIEAESLPNGADSPMRLAVAEAYQRLTGEEPRFLFSGWGAKLTAGERAVVNTPLHP